MDMTQRDYDRMSHDDGTCRHDAGEVCPATQATGEPQANSSGNERRPSPMIDAKKLRESIYREQQEAMAQLGLHGDPRRSSCCTANVYAREGSFDFACVACGAVVAPEDITRRYDAGAQPRGLARLDAAGLAELRAVLFAVFDEREWQISEVHLITSAEEATEERWQLVEAITAAIIRHTTPAAQPTVAGRKP